MKENKLFSAMGNIDEELISEALNASQKKKLPIFRITAAAAAFVFIALAATVLVNINKQPDMIAKPNISNVQKTEKADSTKPASEAQKNEGTVSALNGDNSTKVSDTQPSNTEKPDTEGNSGSVAQPTESTPPAQTSETEQPTVSTPSEQTSKTEQPTVSNPETQINEQPPVEPPQNEDEDSDMLGFIITDDGKTYLQVFYNTQYTLDEDIGRAGDFRGYYSDLDDNSRIYTVKEDENILVVKFESGGSVTLMRREEGLMDRMGYYRFNGLRVDSSLMAALSSNDGKAYSVYVTRPDSDDMYDYVYNGKTLRQMKEELEESWKTEHGKYNPLDVEYQAALDAFLKEKIKAVYDILTENGIQAELINEVRCEMTMTKEQFETLAATASISEEYAFGLSAGNYFVDDEA